MLIKIADEFEKRGLQVVGVAVDEGGPELIKKFVAEYKIDYPILIPPEDSPWSRAEKMPTTLLIDSDGRLAGKYFGAVPEKVLREDIEKLRKAGEGHRGRPSVSGKMRRAPLISAALTCISKRKIILGGVAKKAGKSKLSCDII
jgi:hypothetical protein